MDAFVLSCCGELHRTIEDSAPLAHLGKRQRVSGMSSACFNEWLNRSVD